MIFCDFFFFSFEFSFYLIGDLFLTVASNSTLQKKVEHLEYLVKNSGVFVGDNLTTKIYKILRFLQQAILLRKTNSKEIITQIDHIRSCITTIDLIDFGLILKYHPKTNTYTWDRNDKGLLI